MSSDAEVVVLAAGGRLDDIVPTNAPFRSSVYASPSDALKRVSELRGRSLATVLVVGPGAFNIPAISLELGRRFPDVPVVVATASGSPATAPGPFLAKPAGSPALVAAIRDALRAARQQARVRTTLDRLNVRLRAEASPDPVKHRRLTLSAFYLTAILEQAHDGIIVTDPEGIVAVWNRAARDLFRPPSEDVIGRRLDHAIGGEAGASVLSRIRQLSPDRRTASHELTIDCAGTPRVVEVALSLVFDADQDPIGASVIARDITGERAMQHELQERARALAESNRHKDEFLAILSHELRTPLNAVLGWTQILTRTAGDRDAVQRAAEMIGRNAQLQRRLVEDLLDYARIAAGRLQMSMAPTDVSEAVRRAIDALRPAIENRGLRLAESYAPNLRAAVDEERLRQVVTNLVSNSLKFTDPGGTLQVSVTASDASVHITVADTGHGIVPEFLPFVFDEFRQADPSSTRAQPGLGIGLAIARRIIRLHGGDITAASEGRGRGATFDVTLPILAGGEPPAAASARPPEL